jgi:hypothetical protein
MSRKRDKGRIEGLFVAARHEVLDSPIWKIMSPGARLLYIALKRRYSLERRNNGRIYLSIRDAAEELGLNKNSVTVWFQELEHYGFIVKTSGGCLGVDGRGKAPHWRLTELGFMGDPPTKDYLSWRGERFRPPWKNRIPSQELGQGVPRIRTVMSQELGHLTGKVSQGLGHTADIHCPKDWDISRVTILGGAGGALPEEEGRGAGAWSTPVVTEVFGLTGMSS